MDTTESPPIGWRVSFKLTFPAGLSAGEGSQGNELAIALDGAGRPVLRGSSLAGALRSAYLAAGGSHDVDKTIFGAACGADDAMLTPSRIEVPECILQAGPANVETRKHNQVNRHTGAVLAGGLFAIGALPPKCSTDVVMWLRADETSQEDASRWISWLGAALATGLVLGGRGARGVGLAQVDGPVLHRRYQLASPEGMARWLADRWHWRNGSAGSTGEPVTGEAEPTQILRVNIVLGVPRGQDFLVGSGGGRSEAGPQRVMAADGKEYWRLPGSSLRGQFRAWVSRLAARAQTPVAFSRDRAVGDNGKPSDVSGEDLGWCFLNRDPQFSPGNAAKNIACPVAQLFGSLAARGRVHVTDSFAPVHKHHEQERTHLMIDPISGGAVERLLFSNSVLADAAGAPLRFSVSILVQRPSEQEARWLAACILALDSGLIRVGASKAAGRLALATPPAAVGPHADLFKKLEVSAKFMGGAK